MAAHGSGRAEDRAGVGGTTEEGGDHDFVPDVTLREGDTRRRAGLAPRARSRRRAIPRTISASRSPRRARSSRAITSWAGRPASSPRPTATWPPICARSTSCSRARTRSTGRPMVRRSRDPQPLCRVPSSPIAASAATPSCSALAAGDETIAAIVRAGLCRARSAPHRRRGALGPRASGRARRDGARRVRRPASPRRALPSLALAPRVLGRHSRFEASAAPSTKAASFLKEISGSSLP